MSGYKLNRGDKRFIADTVEKCLLNGIGMFLPFKKTHRGCGGFFDGSSLACAAGHDRFLSIFVHEACHMDQYLEGCRAWKMIPDGIDPFDRSTYDEDESEGLFRKTMLLEHDCDERVLRRVEEYGLSIDKDVYSAQSNVYHASYYYFWKYRCFYKPGKVPYWDDGLVGDFSGRGLMSPRMKWREWPKLGEFIRRHHVKLK
jgi:hypothetical protein